MQEILFPILTGLTLVFAGILVGYFLWFRDRSEQLILSEHLATENERLNAELRGNSSRIIEFEDKVSRLELKNTSMQQLCDDLLSSREKVQLQVNDFESELHIARTEHDKTRQQLTDECRLHSKSEENLLAVKQQYLDSLSEIETGWKEKYLNSQTALNQNNSEIQRLTDLNEQMAERLHSANSETAELKSELSSQRIILDVAKTNAAGLEKEYVSLETTTRSQTELLNESRGQTAAALSAKALAEDAIANHREHIEALQIQLRELEANSTSSEKLQDRCTHLELSLELAQERLEAAVAQRDSFGQSKLDIEHELTALKKRAENQQSTIEQLRSQASATDQRRQKNQQGLLNQIQQLESANEDLLTKCSSLTHQIGDSEKWRSKNDEAFKRVSEDNAILIEKLQQFEYLDRDSLISSDEYQTRIKSVLEQRDAAFDELSSMKSEVKRLQQHAKSNEETIRNLRRERGAILMRNRDSSAKYYPRIHDESLEFSKADQLSSEYGGTITSDPVRGLVFVEAPRERDDLKQIYGVAQVLEQKLNSFGIYTFKQIIEWDDKAIAEFSELLVFKDRIHRDDWLGQAAKLYHRKSRNSAA